MKERSERRWRRRCVWRVAAQGGGAAVQHACECSHGRRRWAGGLAWVQLTWLGCGLAPEAQMK